MATPFLRTTIRGASVCLRCLRAPNKTSCQPDLHAGLIERQLVVLSLKDDTLPKLNLSGSTERINARSDSDAIHVVASGSSSIDLSSCSRQKPAESSTRQVKISKVEKIIEARTRLDCNPLSDLVRPSDFQIQSAQPRKIDLAWRSQWHRRSDGTQRFTGKLLGLL